MFVDRSEALVWDGDFSKLRDAQLERAIQQFEALAAAQKAQNPGWRLP